MTRSVSSKNVEGYLINFIESLRFLESQRMNVSLNSAIGFTAIATRRNTVRTFLMLDPDQQAEFRKTLTGDQKYYFEAFIWDEIGFKKQSVS